MAKSKAELKAGQNAMREMDAPDHKVDPARCIETSYDLFMVLAELAVNKAEENMDKYNEALDFYKSAMYVKDTFGKSISDEQSKKEDELQDKIVFGIYRECLAELEDIVRDKDYSQYERAMRKLGYMKNISDIIGMDHPKAFARLEKKLSEPHFLTIGCDGYP